MIKTKSFALALAALFLSACSHHADKADEAFSAKAAIEMLEALSADEMRGRKVGTTENARAREMIIDRFAVIGIRMVGDDYAQPFTYGGFANRESGESARPDKTGVNVLGYVPGTGESQISMAITAHYDHVGTIDGEIYNGADDNASGVVGLLAAAEYFAANPPRHTIYFVAFDAEEDGLSGARAFVADPPIDLGMIALNMNFDMISRGDNGILWASGTSHWPGMKPLVETVAASAAIDLRMGFDTGNGREDWTLLSDHAAFFRAGIPHLYLGVEDHPDYHRPTDDFERVDQDWFLSAIMAVIEVAEIMDQNLAELFAARQASSAP